MPVDPHQIRKHLQQFAFTDLFIETLGWDVYSGQKHTIMLDGNSYTFSGIAQKRGVAVLCCAAIPPDSNLRRRIDQELTKRIQEHILVYMDRSHNDQLWQWVWREPGQPRKNRELRSQGGQKLQAITEQLAHIAISIEEEENLTLLDVTSRVRAAFNVETVTRRFYDYFKTEHDAFLKFLAGIPDEEQQRWYASVMLNRLMFIYFIQKKGFLDGGDTDYLRHKLEACQGNFYRDFLLRLFFVGFAREEAERSPEDRRLLGELPYLNGGLFLPHQIEQLHGKRIDIPNEAFARIFDFFDRYRWHLDERPLREDNEINPDVLGYIFEKYINQKQMGAYYTKEDITEYISRNTIIPFLFDRARESCRIAFEGGQSVWDRLQENPADYIYPAVKKGVELPLPQNIAAGLDDISRRRDWNTPTPEEYGLPTEIWRETVARRQRYEEVRGKLVAGEVRDINDLITYNLDIQQFAQDTIDHAEEPELLRAFWKAITSITVLDPTCGSGAFLFAALNILQPLYEGCLNRMEAFVDEADARGESRLYPDFREVLREVAQHPNRAYFIFKHIVVNNLYGVDIMDEAVEIAKLRLFLKLVAQIDDVKQVEPLPDIDFNIRAGNTLVGFTSWEEVERAMTHNNAGQMRMLFPEEREALQHIKEQAADFQRLYDRFKEQQTAIGGRVTLADKQALKQRLSELATELNHYLAHLYNVEPDTLEYPVWERSHQPFHWLTEFYGIMDTGGFDVIIGNPPYVNISKLNYVPSLTYNYPDIYANVVIRIFPLSQLTGRLGMIVPLSITFSRDFADLRVYLCKNGIAWFSSYDNIPAAVFYGVSQRCTIWIEHKQAKNKIFTSRMRRWRSEYRPLLTAMIGYTSIDGIEVSNFGIPKLDSSTQVHTLKAIESSPQFKPEFQGEAQQKQKGLGFAQSARNFVSVFLEAPPTLEVASLSPVSPSKIGYLPFLKDEQTTRIMLSVTAGELFFWYWLTRGDGFDVTSWVVSDYVTHLGGITISTGSLLARLGDLLHQRRNEALAFKKNAGKYVGNYNYRSLYQITRRADLLFMSALCLDTRHAIEIFDYAQRVLSINVYAGEKAIPARVKQQFISETINIQEQDKLFAETDDVIRKYYGFTDEELDFIINYDIKYRMGDDLNDIETRE